MRLLFILCMIFVCSVASAEEFEYPCKTHLEWSQHYGLCSRGCNAEKCLTETGTIWTSGDTATIRF